MNQHVIDYSFHLASIEFWLMNQMRSHMHESLDAAQNNGQFPEGAVRNMRSRVHAMVTGQCRSITKKLTQRLLRERGFDYHSAEVCHANPQRAASNEEHCVPVGLIHRWILGIPTPHDVTGHACQSAADAYRLLKENFIVANVTVPQHQALQPANGMPARWNWLIADKMGRYRNASVPFPYFPSAGQNCPHCGD